MTLYTTKNKITSLIRKRIVEANIILDIGCGIRPQNLIQPLVHICADPHQEYLDYIKQHFEHKSKSVYIAMNLQWKDLVNTFTSKSVDTVFLLDVIEHIDKAEAKKLLKLTQNIVRKQIIIFTPYGFIEQNHTNDIDAWGLHGGKWQSHHSGWLPKDFGVGWETYVVKKFHFTNNLNEKYSSPKGAMWAIYNSNESDTNINHNRELNLQLYQASINAHLGKMTKLFILFFKLTRKILNKIVTAADRV